MPNTAASPWKMFLPLGLVLLLGLLWSGYWLAARSYVEARVAVEREALAAQGLTLACTEEGWGGFPFHFEFTCRSPVLRYGTRAELRTEHLLAVALAYAPWQLALLIDGPTTVAATGLSPTRIEHQRAIAAVTLDRDWAPQLSSEVPSLAIPGVGEARNVMLHSRPSPKGSGTDIAVSFDGFTWTPADKEPLSLEQGRVLGTLQEGTFTLSDAEARLGAVLVRGSGKVALDPAHRPQGQLDLETNNTVALLRLLKPYLALTEEQAANLQTTLALLGNEAKAPLIAKDGVLYLGPFRLTELPPLY